MQERITSQGRTFVVARETIASAEEGALLKVDLNDPRLSPTNQEAAEGTPLTLLSAPHVKVDLSRRTKAPMPFWHRNADADELIVCLAGEIHWETELGEAHLKAGEMLLIPRGVAHRSLPGTPPPGGTNLVLELKVEGALTPTEALRVALEGERGKAR
jgi:mannose-6-phosphate isomerase-like protein (cupin superfamily)